MDPFTGFSEETIRFFKDLENNNSKAWFNANRHVFDTFVMPQAQAFVVEMGERLASSIAPGIQAIPKTDKSIFRIHRDIRFSPDKRPYKTHLGLYLWEGPGKKMESPGFYFQLSPEGFMLGGGMHMIPKQLMSSFRDAVVNDVSGPELQKAMETVMRNKDFILQEKRYKRTPRGYDPQHPRADLLLYDGIACMYESKDLSVVQDAQALDFIFEKFLAMAPLHHWFLNFVNRNTL